MKRNNENFENSKIIAEQPLKNGETLSKPPDENESGDKSSVCEDFTLSEDCLRVEEISEGPRPSEPDIIKKFNLMTCFERFFKGTKQEFYQIVDKALATEKRMVVVTANPEILTHAENHSEIKDLLFDVNLELIPDGISVVKAMNMLGFSINERITGVDLVNHLLCKAGQTGKSIFLFGAKEEVVQVLAQKLMGKYPQAKVAYQNGYVKDPDKVMEELKACPPDVIIVAMGVPVQDLLIHRHYKDFAKGVFVGAGGSLDVLSGMKKRAPSFFIKTNTEWLYRILKEPFRIRRFYENNIKFMLRVKKIKKR